MNSFKKIYTIIKRFTKRLSDDQVSAFAAQASFFIMLSLFPIIILLLSLIRFTPVTKGLLLTVAVDIFPDTLDPLIVSIIEEMYTMSSGTVISITAITAVWSASKGIISLIRGLNFIYHTKERRNYFHLRIIASLYTIILVIGIVASLVLLVFGNALVSGLEQHAPTLHAVISTLTSFKFLLMPIFLTLFFVLIYKVVPNKRYNFMTLLPGAAFSAIGWLIFSSAYSFYVDNFSGASYMYGSLTTVIFLMFWLYFGLYIVFLGAEINLFFMNYFDKLHSLRKQRLTNAKERYMENHSAKKKHH